MQVGATFRMEQSAQPQETVGKEADQNGVAVRPDRQGSSYPVQKDTVDFSKVDALPLDKGQGVRDSQALPPPPLRKGTEEQADVAQKGVASASKPVRDGILRPWDDASAGQIQIPGVATDKGNKGQVDVQTKAEPVVKAIKEKVENLFKIYPNGGQNREEKVDVPAARSLRGGATPALAQKQAVSVNLYA
ncbi:MAG: hypothetical protein HQL63_08745 [Magnetococcales bacterium]|nr:hypothetical protein [Magnetococcales bacterium]MBF0322211.1 hypothetical protein [Magnetococcales bacterium]